MSNSIAAIVQLSAHFSIHHRITCHPGTFRKGSKIHEVAMTVNDNPSRATSNTKGRAKEHAGA